jgi:transcriptional regulator with XRE-family HTH domain
MPSIPQFRAARGLLGWSQTDLAKAAGLSLPTVKRFETAGARVSVDAVAAMRLAIEAAGVEFTNHEKPGVRLVGTRRKAKTAR